jgi:hypothetical protein
MDGLFPTIFHGERSELREKYRLESLIFYGATWLRQDCARPAILIHLFQK